MTKQQERVLSSTMPQHVNQEVKVSGWITARRDHGKLIFFDIRDRSGLLQVVVNPTISKQAYEVAQSIKPEYVVSIWGKVNKRPERLVNQKIESGTVELAALEIEILAKAHTLPFDLGTEDLNLELPTLLDHRALVLRHPKVKAIFKVQEVIVDAFREFMKQNQFMEFQAPTITPATAEGGAEVFEVNYFDHKAYLTQSPQLYKQIVMSAFERVFSVNKVFRAEPSVTTRHLTEIVSLDAEMGFINSWEDIRDMAEATVKYILKQVGEKCSRELELYGVTLPQTVERTPTLSLREAQEEIYKRSGRDVRGEKDLNPEDEREICTIIKEETGSDLVFVYGYPTKQKPFYVYPNPEEPEYNEGIDLLCRGVEWMSGGRRVNDYEQLEKHVKEWKMNPENISMFLEAFRYGVPPEGGFALGLERLTMQILELQNIREASLFPRDMERVDERFSQKENTKE